MSDPLSLPRLHAVTRAVGTPEDPLPFASPEDPLVWLRRGDGIVGAGPDVVRIDVGEDDRLDAIADVWRAIAASAEIDDDVRLPGTGLIGFGAFVFDDSSSLPSTLVVPSTIVGRRAGRGWVTRIGRLDAPAVQDAPATTSYGPHWSATLGPGAVGPEAHVHAVERALDAIEAGELEKIVIARDITGSLPPDADLRRLVRALAEGYPDTWAYAVDGMIGASPETLVTVSGGEVTARVLAGTRPRGADADEDTAVAAELASTAKDLDEHRYAVESVLAALRPRTSALAAAEQPFTLKLPNVWHLATDIDGTLADGGSALDMVRALHPTAAVAGTPTPAAIDAIRRIEPFDRGRYAGPVGWIDANGDGEWAISLRCAQIGPRDGERRTITAYAGGGIVAGSRPDAELLETRVKFRPIVDALA